MNLKNKILKMRPLDFPKLREFILREHEQLERKDFFIIDDLDSELPSLLDGSRGVVLAAHIDGALIGVQAICFQPNDKLTNIIKSKNIMPACFEASWSFVETKYRLQGIANSLYDKCEIFCKKEFDEFLLLATIHPENEPSLRFYNGNGFTSLSRIVHFDKDRLLMMKYFGAKKVDFFV